MLAAGVLKGIHDRTLRPAVGDATLCRCEAILLHLIEETARHAGHADFLREAIDGSVGE